jgi:phage recombination protein Bet
VRDSLNAKETMLMTKAEYEVNGDKITLTPSIIKRYLVSGTPNSVTDEEVVMFMQICKAQKLNPFLREAYLIKYGGQPAAIVTGKDTFTKRAAKSTNSDGQEAGIIVQNANKQVERRTGTFYIKNQETLVGGWAKAYRKDKKYPVEVTVSLDEYIGKKKDGTINSNWTQRPATMIRKVALVQALREAFPEDFEGLYSPEEMVVDDKDLSDDPIDVEQEILNEQEVEAAPRPVQKGQKQYLMQLGAEKGLVTGEGKDADVSKLEALANENKISLRGLTYDTANALLKIVEEYQEVIDVEPTPVEEEAKEPTEDTSEPF